MCALRVLPGVFSCSDRGVIASLRRLPSVGWICKNSPCAGVEDMRTYGMSTSTCMSQEC